MKVTVCFGNVRVVVPCGDGDILVKDLIREATLRYKKATGKGSDSWVSVHNLQSQGGGILDPDDRLSDVADDREQILASFEDGEGAHLHGGGDGASGSSVGTGSPDIFHDGDHHKYVPPYYPSRPTDIEVTGEQAAAGVPALQVRRGSEPSLAQLLPPGGGGRPQAAPGGHPKRWSAAPPCADGPPAAEPVWAAVEDGRPAAGGGFRRAGREGGGSNSRLSMQFLGADGAGHRWAEAADRAASSTRPPAHHLSASLPRDARRREPLGQATTAAAAPPPTPAAEAISIASEPGPLGVHVVPDHDAMGGERGLLVKGVEPGGRVDRDGRLRVGDRVVEINGEDLVGMSFQRVQELFKLSLTSPELRLKVIKSSGPDGLRKPPPPVYPCYPDDKENVSMVECEQKQSTNTKVATVSPTKKVPAISKNLKGLMTANTRKIGRKIEIELVKGPQGLGFSITTRDNPAGGKCPIYIKNINAMGPAIEDGRLKIGDRLLEVNNSEMSGKTQSEAVALLKSLPLGSKVKIVVSRQEDVVDNSLPRIIDVDLKDDREERTDEVPPNIPPLPQSHLQALQNRSPDKGSVAKIISQYEDAVSTNPFDQIDESLVFPWKHRELLTYNIPVHDSEKAGLGISVKGKTGGSSDLGIFIKGVMFGGAASRDSRLRTDDQLLNVNGVSLLRQSNSDAMETLKNAIPHTEGPVPGHITVTVARRVASPDSSVRSSSGESGHNGFDSVSQEKSDSNSVDNSGTSGGSTNTVIFNPQGGKGNLSEVSQNSNGNINVMSPMHTWNPVLERITGNSKQQQQLRNESYYKATHDTWTTSMLGNISYGNSTIVNMIPGEPILIEDEYGSRVMTNPNQQINVHMTNKLPEGREPDGRAAAPSSTDATDAAAAAPTATAPTDATYASQLSLENANGFSRDAFGRQSMSEKRHATLDAKSTDTYQRSKKMREERRNRDTSLVRVGSVESVISVNRSSEHPEYADKLGQLGPSLGMKKSSSLESLQTMVQEIQMQEEGDPAYSYRGPNGALKVIRGRGCEESFRAAVVDPNHRSEIAKKHWLLDGPTQPEKEIEGFNHVRGAPRQSSLNAAIDLKNKSAKKKPGIFKGIGSMFRFGKHRKMELQPPEPVQSYHPPAEFDANANPAPVPPTQQDPDAASHGSQPEKQPETHHPSQKQPQKQAAHHAPPQGQNAQQFGHNFGHGSHNSSMNSQHSQGSNHSGQGSHHSGQSTQREPLYQRHGLVHRHAEQVQVIPENSVVPPVKYRQNSSEQRRNERESHKQRMQQRHTYYQTDEREPIYDHRHQPQQRVDPANQFIEYGRPGSRSGITESSVPFTHYVNYNELQNHISRKQHQYHSQRQTRADPQLRPASNYYEYESVQSVLNQRAARPNAQPPNAQQQQPPAYPDHNSNSLPRNNQPVQGRHARAANRGPFVTQVTIGEHQQNGTKV